MITETNRVKPLFLRLITVYHLNPNGFTSPGARSGAGMWNYGRPDDRIGFQPAADANLSDF